MSREVGIEDRNSADVHFVHPQLFTLHSSLFTIHYSSASAGHGRAQVAVTHPPSGNAGSTPARRIDSARSSSGSGRQLLTLARRVRFSHGSCSHVRQNVGFAARAHALASVATVVKLLQVRPSGEIGRHATLRTSSRQGMGVRVSPWSSMTTQVSQCSAEAHNLSPPGATPGPAIGNFRFSILDLRFNDGAESQQFITIQNPKTKIQNPLGR